jgi:hypothetical protein
MNATQHLIAAFEATARGEGDEAELSVSIAFNHSLGNPSDLDLSALRDALLRLAPLDGILVPREELDALARYVKERGGLSMFANENQRLLGPLLARLPKPEPVPAPCPWCKCDGDPDGIVFKDAVGVYRVVSSCGAAGPRAPTAAKATEDWNRVAKGER